MAMKAAGKRRRRKATKSKAATQSTQREKSKRIDRSVSSKTRSAYFLVVAPRLALPAPGTESAPLLEPVVAPDAAAPLALALTMALAGGEGSGTGTGTGTCG